MTVTVANIRTTLLDSGFSTADISDATIQGFIDMITAEVQDAEITHENIAGYSLNTSIETTTIKYGALAQTLYALRTHGASRGLTSDMTTISTETADRYQANYIDMLNNIRSGIKYGT